MAKLNFGQALDAVKQGEKIARAGWNGKGMFVFERPADELSLETFSKVKSIPESIKQHILSKAQGETISFGAYLCMIDANGKIVNGWLASQTDILADDWCIV